MGQIHGDELSVDILCSDLCDFRAKSVGAVLSSISKACTSPGTRLHIVNFHMTKFIVLGFSLVYLNIYVLIYVSFIVNCVVVNSCQIQNCN